MGESLLHRTSENYSSTSFVNRPLPANEASAYSTKEPEPLSKDSGILPAPLGVALSQRVYSPH